MTESEINCPIQENSIDKHMKCLVTLFWSKAISNCILEKHVHIPLSSLVSISRVNSGKYSICAWWLEEMIFSRIYLLIIISKAVYWVDPNVMRICDTWILYLCFRLTYIPYHQWSSCWIQLHCPCLCPGWYRQNIYYGGRKVKWYGCVMGYCKCYICPVQHIL